MGYNEIERLKRELIDALSEAGLEGEKIVAAIEALIDAKIEQTERAIRDEIYGET